MAGDSYNAEWCAQPRVKGSNQVRCNRFVGSVQIRGDVTSLAEVSTIVCGGDGRYVSCVEVWCQEGSFLYFCDGILRSNCRVVI